MPLRDPVFNPPFNIVRASHVELGVSDLAKSRAFYVDCLGYIVSDEDTDVLYLRGVEERNHHSVVLRKSKDICDRLQGRQRGGPRQGRRMVRCAQAACVVAESAVPGTHAAHR
jgi:catechol 2,3-dioxygenase-like lactoylglutathione lyase family enzyme